MIRSDADIRTCVKTVPGCGKHVFGHFRLLRKENADFPSRLSVWIYRCRIPRSHAVRRCTEIVGPLRAATLFSCLQQVSGVLPVAFLFFANIVVAACSPADTVIVF